ncbi:MAG: Gfo/Idh/MocA family oxidoreductase [Planctomycetota bacterium]|nr:MAG: Gfo/Idh/MocA family oxidoreductase [Planctomycetota bacterium]
MARRINQSGKVNRKTRRDFMKNTGAIAASVGVTTLAPGRTLAKALGANDRINIGFIGCGNRTGTHLSRLVPMKENGENIEFVAFNDAYRPRMEWMVEKFSGKSYFDYRELLADRNVDAVFICTPDHHHGYQTIDAVKAGKDVYCEKPITHWRQFELAKKVVEVVAESDRVLLLGTQYMSDSAYRQARKLIEDGLIGQPIHAECGYFRLGDWAERGMRIDDPDAKPGPNLNWEAFLGDSPKRPFDVSRFFRWRMYMDYSGGPATDNYPHLMTQVIMMLGVKFPSKVVATGGIFRYPEREVPDTFNILIDYPEKISLVVVGTQGNNHQGNWGYYPGRSPVIRGWEGTLTLEGNIIRYTPARGRQQPLLGKKEMTFPVEHPANMERYYGEFFSCIRNRKKQTASPADLAYYVQTPIHMAMVSWLSDKVARFDAQKEKVIL